MHGPTTLVFNGSNLLFQVAVTLYVFCKSWSPSADRRLLATAILLFILGVFKCFEKPLALKRNSFDSLVTSFHPTPRSETTNREVDLEGYIQDAKVLVENNKRPPSMDRNGKSPDLSLLSEPDKLFVDLGYDHTDRLKRLKSFLLTSKPACYQALCTGLSKTFDLIYSKEVHDKHPNRNTEDFSDCCSLLLFFLTMTLPIVPIGLFHSSHKEAYKGSDIKVTFALLYITYLLEISSFITVAYYDKDWPDVVAQHSIIGFLAHNRRHTWLMGIAELLQCKGLLDTYFCLKPCEWTTCTADLVHKHVKDGWMNYIEDVESYWKFSDSRGHWTLERNGCEGILREYIEKPFDESIILWHVATYFCFHTMDDEEAVGSSAAGVCLQYIVMLFYRCKEVLESAAGVLWWLLERCKAALKTATGILRWLFGRCKAEVKSAIKQPQEESDTPVSHREESDREFPAYLYRGACKVISNYMMHLLVANPEMLMPGSRRNLFTSAYRELEDLLQGDDVSRLDEEKLTRKIIDKLDPPGKGFLYDAVDLALALRRLGREKEWEVIRGVWIEMLCFSAARCRGYLHAKSLGSGGEYLTFVALLMSRAGLETFPERQQRVQLRMPKEERVTAAKQRIQEAARNEAAASASAEVDAVVP
ncbi:unnamed protein product [Urochloa humidicola]